jgi:predicted hydrocarbon binding protein
MMMAIPDSKLFMPNRDVRVTFLAMEEVMGKNGVHAVLNLGNLLQYVDNYPPSNLERDIDFAVYSTFFQALEEMYGMRGAKLLAFRGGRAYLNASLPFFTGQTETAESYSKDILPNDKVISFLKTFSEFTNKTSDQVVSIKETGTTIVYSIERCPVCWGRKTDHTACSFTSGVLQEGLKWATGGKIVPVEQSACAAMGAADCEFSILKENIQ